MLSNATIGRVVLEVEVEVESVDDMDSVCYEV